MPTKPKKNLDSSLVGRKCTAKYNHMWFGQTLHNIKWDDPIPTEQGTIVAAYYHREKDGSGGVKVLIESAKGETLEYYVDSVVLVPVPPHTLKLIDRLRNLDGLVYSGERKAAHEELCSIIEELQR